MDAVRRWSRAGFWMRIVVLAATGGAWTVVSLQSVLLHPDFWDPVTFSDWFAIWAYSATWLLTAAAIVIFGAVSQPDTATRRTIVIAAIAAAATGTANGLEDGLGIAGFGSIYVAGILTATLALIFVAALTWGGPSRRMAFVPLLGAVAAFGMVLGGGLLALVAWLGLASLLVRARPTAP